MKISLAGCLQLTVFAAMADTGLAPYLDKGYAIAPDQANARVVVFDATKASTSAQPTDVVWTWNARDEGSGVPSDMQGRFWQVDEAKLRDSGNTLLVSSSGAAWAEVDVATKKARRCGIAGDNTHSIEKLPDNTLVLAHSTNYNRLQLVWGEGTDLTYKNVYSIYSAHGVEWDVKRNCLWALGYTNLVQLAYDPAKKTLTEQKRWIFNPSGHDMRLCADGKIYFTNWYTVWEFDPDHDTEPKARFWKTDVKGFHTNATYGDVYQVASGNYWNDHVVVNPISGQSFDVYPKNASKMYKVHWATAYPASFAHEDEPEEPPVPEDPRTRHGWYAVDFTDPGYRAGVDWTDVSDVAAPGGVWTRQDENSVFDAVTRTLRLSNTTNLCYRPFKSSAKGADTELDFRVKVYVASSVPEMPEGSIAGFSFLVEQGKVVPYGYAGGVWHALPGGGWRSNADWADLKVSFDFASANAPTVSYLLDGRLLSTFDGVSALPFGGGRRCVTALSFTGTAELGNLTGNFYTLGPWPLGFGILIK